MPHSENPFKIAAKSLSRQIKNQLSKYHDEKGLNENMRALRLAITIADWLLSLGVTTSDVTATALSITRTLCSRPVHFDIMHTVIFASQDRGDRQEPLSLTHTINERSSDYQKIQRLQELSNQIKDGKVNLKKAEDKLDEIINAPRPYANWITHIASGLLSAGVMIMFSADPIVWVAALIMGCIVSLLLYRLGKTGLSSFYSQAVAGFFIVVFAGVVSILAANGIIPVYGYRDPTFIIVGGIMLLVAGMMVAAAFQDAIDEYYITAASRLLKTAMTTGGIIFGVGIGIYLVSKFGVTLASTPENLSFSPANFQYAGAAILAAAFALSKQANWVGILSAGVAGALSFYSMLFFSSLGLDVIPASGVAAMLVGLFATISTHWLRVPSIAVMEAGIIPLVPGLTLYSAMTFIATSTPDSTTFDQGISLLIQAVIIAVTIAASVTVGNIIGRPAQRRMIHLQNRLPQYRRLRKD